MSPRWHQCSQEGNREGQRVSTSHRPNGRNQPVYTFAGRLCPLILLHLPIAVALDGQW
jgi:hypothetical protein